MRREHTSYNKYAGHDLGRLGTLTDNIFAVSMTLLVLGLRVPDPGGIHSETELLSAAKELLPRLMLYLMSFSTLGIFWIGNQTLLSQMEKSDRHFAWLNLASLVLITGIPFSTSLLGSFITFHLALFIYWLNILLFGISVLASWYYARRAGLTKPDPEGGFHRALVRRVYIAQALYLFAVLLSLVFNTHVGITLIILIQLNYVIAPKLIFRRH